MAKKQRKKKKTSKRYALYEAKDGLKRKNKFCPKCGAGIFLAQHKDRLVCGKCSYMEKIDDKKEAPVEKKPENKEQKPETKKE